MIWWLVDPYRLLAAFEHRTPLTVLGAVFLPCTTMAYAMVWSPSSAPFGADLMWLGLGLAADVVLYVTFYYNSLLVEIVSGQWLRRKQP
jgi:hypothetical protein